MKPFVSDPDFTLYVGDVRDVLAELPDESVDCVVTSPPYWGLRDYGTGEWQGGDVGCDHAEHVGGPVKHGDHFRATAREERRTRQYGQMCAKCGATRVDRQIGLEASPDEFVEQMVEVFRQVRRVLVSHGTLWLNLGDSYGAKTRGSDAGWDKSRLSNPGTVQKAQAASLRKTGERHRGAAGGVKEKDLVGIPWRVAFALQADGWYLTALSYENPGNRTTNGPRSEDRKHKEFGSAGFEQRLERRSETVGWKSTCDHDGFRRPGIVFDPFMGSGTVALVARRLGRHAVGVELNPEYGRRCARGVFSSSRFLLTRRRRRDVGASRVDVSAVRRHERPRDVPDGEVQGEAAVSPTGSHATYAGWEPRVCCDCGRKTTLKDAAMHNFDHATAFATTLCGDCLLRRSHA